MLRSIRSPAAHADPRAIRYRGKGKARDKEVLVECYMMSRRRAEALATALRKKYGRRAKKVDPGSVRMYCITTAENERDPLDCDWLESGQIDEVVAWIDLEKLLGQRH